MCFNSSVQEDAFQCEKQMISGLAEYNFFKKYFSDRFGFPFAQREVYLFMQK